MLWKTLIGALALVAAAMIIAALKRREPPESTLGAVSPSWIAEHRSGLDS